MRLGGQPYAEKRRKGEKRTKQGRGKGERRPRSRPQWKRRMGKRKKCAILIHTPGARQMMAVATANEVIISVAKMMSERSSSSPIKREQKSRGCGLGGGGRDGTGSNSCCCGCSGEGAQLTDRGVAIARSSRGGRARARTVGVARAQPTGASQSRRSRASGKICRRRRPRQKGTVTESWLRAGCFGWR